MTTFVVLEPDEWGMRWARPPVAERLADPETYIHHRGGNPAHYTDAAVAFRELNEWTISAKGYSATDYDILVHEHIPSDTVTLGIARAHWMSAATKDRNEEGEAICALGYFHPGHSLSERPSAAMLEGLARAVVLSIERGWSAPDTKILGHRDNPEHPWPESGSPCPGDYLYAELPTIRRRVAELLTPTPPPPPLGGDMQFYSITGKPRVMDTRTTGGMLPRGGQRTVPAHEAGLPPGTKAVAVNVTAVDAEDPGFLTAWPSGVMPNSSFVNYRRGDTIAGFTIVGLSGFGTFEIAAPAGGCHVIVDVVGAFA